MDMKRNYIAPAVFVIVAENGNLLEASPNIGYNSDGKFDKEGGETIWNGGEDNGATPAKGFSGWESDWDKELIW